MTDKPHIQETWSIECKHSLPCKLEWNEVMLDIDMEKKLDEDSLLKDSMIFIDAT